VTTPGLKYNLPDLQSAIGIHQLRKLGALNAERARLAQRYDVALAALPALKPLGTVPYPHRHSHHLYVVRLQLEQVRIDRNEFMAAVMEAGVGLGLHFTAVHELTYYRARLGDLRGALPVATEASRRLFSLPLFPGLSDAEQDRVIEVLADTVRAYRR
jgi:UDP-4-amino-4-deoxy-L-arabinose-oxoglutarate aminotransferase